MQPLKRYSVGSPEHERIEAAMKKVFAAVDDMSWAEVFDVMTNCLSHFLKDMDNEEAREYVLQCLNRFVLLEVMGKDAYEEAVDQASQVLADFQDKQILNDLEAKGPIPPKDRQH